MHSMCCIHGQISLLVTEISKQAGAAPSWSSASSPLWKSLLPKLCFYLWSSIYCLSTEMLLSMVLVKSKWTKVVKAYNWNSLNQGMSAVSCDDKTQIRRLLQTAVSKATGQSCTQRFISILFHFLFYHLVKCFHWLHLLSVLSGMTTRLF